MPAAATKHPHAVRVSPFDSVGAIVRRVGEAFERHGEVVQVRGLPMRIFAVRHPDLLRRVLTAPVTGPWKRPRLLPRVRHVMGKGAYILKGGGDWQARRRLLQPFFVPARVPELAACAESAAGRACARLRASGGTADLFAETKRLVLDLACRAFFSYVPGEDECAALFDHTHRLEEGIVDRLPLWLPTPANLGFRREAARLRALMRSILRARKASGEKCDDVLGAILGAPEEILADDEARVDEMLSVYLGASVMGTTLAWAFALLARHPRILEHLRNEPAFACAVLDETLRLYPGSWAYPRQAQARFELGGVAVPKGALVFCMVYHAHRHPDFWREPERFDPSRFEAAARGARHPFAHLPYGAGARRCLGASVAPALMQAVLGRLAGAFDFRPELQRMPDPGFGFEIAPRGGVPLKLGKRVLLAPAGIL